MYICHAGGASGGIKSARAYTLLCAMLGALLRAADNALRTRLALTLKERCVCLSVCCLFSVRLSACLSVCWLVGCRASKATDLLCCMVWLVGVRSAWGCWALSTPPG